MDRATIRAGLVFVRARCHKVLREAEALDAALVEEDPGLPAAEEEFRKLYRLAECGQDAGELLLREAVRMRFLPGPKRLRRATKAP